MGVTASTGPIVVFGGGITPTDYNSQRGPSVFDQFLGLADPRQYVAYQPGQADAAPIAIWLSGGQYCAVDQVPSTIAANNIAASQSPGAGAITLVVATAAGITVGVSISRIDTGATVTGLLAIDGAQVRQSFGQQGTVQAWDPTKAVARNVRITSGGNDTGITFTVSGYDVYGAPMTETITGVSGATASGKKAFKYISGVTHTGSVATTVTIGTGDVYGFPLRHDLWGDADIFWNDGLITATTGYLAAVTTTATATTGDVRGTYAVQSASDNAKRLRVWQRVTPANIIIATGLVGVTQA